MSLGCTSSTPHGGAGLLLRALGVAGMADTAQIVRGMVAAVADMVNLGARERAYAGITELARRVTAQDTTAQR